MPTLPKNAHIHLIGICGTAMASLAGILQQLGYRVTGSDQNVYPPMSTQLASLGIPIQLGFKKENLDPRPDLVIVGNVVSRSNPEAEAAVQLEIPYTSLPKSMGEFVIADRDSYVVAGTHGKTTTTSLLAWVSDALGMQAGFLIGGIPLNYGQSFRAPKGTSFVIEGDEYDTAYFDKVPKFVHYRPKHVILTSVEFDHADIYRDLDHVKSAFRTLLELIPEDGTLIYNADDKNIPSILSVCRAKRQYGYGLKRGDFRATDREVLQGRNQFTVVHADSHAGDQRIADVAVKVFGEHNTANVLAVFALGEALQWPRTKVLQAFADFKGVKRRQELLGEIGGITVIEDFAHHPTAVDLTLRCMRERFPGQRVVAVFEPRSATSRRKVFQQEYAAAFAQSDVIFLSQPFDQSKIDAADRFSTDELIESLRRKGKVAESAASVDALVHAMQPILRKGDVVLIMSNGGFDGIYQKLFSALQA